MVTGGFVDWGYQAQDENVWFEDFFKVGKLDMIGGLFFYFFMEFIWFGIEA